MANHMKTTIDISDALYKEARRVAHDEHTTVKALVEEGLRRALTEHKHCDPFKLRKTTFKGKGLQPDFSGASWEQIRGAAYEGRSG